VNVKNYFVLIAWALMLFPRFATAQGNLVVNGGFNANASGWTATDVSIPDYLTTGGNPSGFFGLYNASASAVPTVSQQINSLVPGSIYLVSGDYKSGGKGVASNSFGVAFNGVYVFLASSPTDYNWHSFSFEYAATSISELLSVSSQLRATGYAYYIDNIAMSAVPEPSTLTLLSFSILLFTGGCCGLTIRRSRRRLAVSVRIRGQQSWVWRG
jgi:hypothetical protein